MLSNIYNSNDSDEKIASGKLFKELNAKGLFYANVIHWTTLFLLPLFWLLDYLFLPDKWVDLLLIRIIVTVLTYVVYIWGNARRWPYYVTVSIFCSINVLLNAILCATLPVTGMLTYFLIFAVMMLLFNITIFWKPVYSLIQYVLASVAMAICFRLTHKYDGYSELINNGGGLFIVLGAVSCFIAGNRYELLSRDVQNTLQEKQRKAY